MKRIGTILKKQSDPIHDLGRFSLTPAGEALLNEARAAEEVSAPPAPVQSVRQAYDGPADGQPKPEWIRGVCPVCAGPVVSNAYYVGGQGYLILAECWGSLSAAPTCDYRKVL